MRNGQLYRFCRAAAAVSGHRQPQHGAAPACGACGSRAPACRRALRRSAGSARVRFRSLCGLVVKNGTNRLDVSGRPGPSSSTVSCRKPSTCFQSIHTRAAGFERRVDGVADDVDQQLLELIGVGLDLHVVGPLDVDRQPVLELGDALRQRHDLDRRAPAAWAAAPAARTRAGSVRALPIASRSGSGRPGSPRRAARPARARSSA